MQAEPQDPADWAISPEEEPPTEWADERRFVDEKIAAGVETVSALWIFAIIPIGLVYLLLQKLLGPYGESLGWLGYLVPVAPLAAVLLVPAWYRWRSPMPLHPKGRPALTGAAKRRAITLGAGFVVVLAALLTWGPVLEARALEWLREALRAWRL